MGKKYYEAYEERYKKIHNENLTWFSKEMTPELLDWIEYYHIPKTERICEVGCGEGRDTVGLAKLGYLVTGIDISEEAIKFCKNLAKKEKVNVEFIRQDATCLQELNKKFNYLYSIATLHMLVKDEDRLAFLSNLYNLLEDNGKCLLLNLGDGNYNYQTNIEEAFDLQKRNHYETSIEVMVAATSFRCVDYETHRKEIEKAGFSIEHALTTSNKEFSPCMTMYLVKK